MDIVFIRHGRTETNEKGQYGGFNDIPLSFRGEIEAGDAAKQVEGREFNSIYLSPLKRACQTSGILGFQGKSDDRLREMNFGIFEGLSYKDALERYPKETEKWTSDYINYRIPGGESLREVYERVTDFLRDISKGKGTILVVTHEGVIKCALCSIFDTPEYFYRFKADHCRFTQIAIEEGYKYIKSLNSEKIY
jgi:alpha-ribazole phosphatase